MGQERDDKQERPEHAVSGREHRLAWAAAGLGIVIMAALVWLGIRYLSAGGIRSEIPALPELARKPAAVASQVTAADEDARRNPRSGDALGKLAMVYHANAFHERARIAYQLAIRVDPGNPRWPYYLAVLEITNGENERAISFLARSLELDPEHPNAWARLGQLYFAKEMPGEAEAAFSRALALVPTHQHAILGMARLAGLRGDWMEAAMILEQALRVDPGFRPAHGVLVMAYEHLGRAEDARRHQGLGGDTGFQMDDPLLDELYGLSSTSSMLVTQAAIASIQGDYRRVGELLTRAVLVAPEDKDARLALARFLATPGFTDRARLEEARRHLEVGLEIDPAYVKMRDQHARVLYALGETAAAEAEWQAIIKEEPEHAMALVKLAQLSSERRDFARAIDLYRRALDVPRDTPFTLGEPAMAYQELGLTHWSAGHTAEALAAFRMAHETDPRLGTAYVLHAQMLEELARRDEALALYRDAIASEPYDVATRLGYGNLLLASGRHEEAADELAAGLELSPGNPKAHYLLGIALLGQGRKDEAIPHFETAIELDPSYELARDALSAARTR